MKKILSALIMVLFINSISLGVHTGHRTEPHSNTFEVEGVLYITGESEPYSGVIVTSYSKGGVKEIIEYKDGLVDGELLLYYPSGNLSVKTTHKMGKLHGDFKM